MLTKNPPFEKQGLQPRAAVMADTRLTTCFC